MYLVMIVDYNTSFLTFFRPRAYLFGTFHFLDY